LISGIDQFSPSNSPSARALVASFAKNSVETISVTGMITSAVTKTPTLSLGPYAKSGPPPATAEVKKFVLRSSVE